MASQTKIENLAKFTANLSENDDFLNQVKMLLVSPKESMQKIFEMFYSQIHQVLGHSPNYAQAFVLGLVDLNVNTGENMVKNLEKIWKSVVEFKVSSPNDQDVVFCILNGILNTLDFQSIIHYQYSLKLVRYAKEHNLLAHVMLTPEDLFFALENYETLTKGQKKEYLEAFADVMKVRNKKFQAQRLYITILNYVSSADDPVVDAIIENSVACIDTQTISEMHENPILKSTKLFSVIETFATLDQKAFTQINSLGSLNKDDLFQCFQLFQLCSLFETYSILPFDRALEQLGLSDDRSLGKLIVIGTSYRIFSVKMNQTKREMRLISLKYYRNFSPDAWKDLNAQISNLQSQLSTVLSNANEH